MNKTQAQALVHHAFQISIENNLTGYHSTHASNCMASEQHDPNMPSKNALSITVAPVPAPICLSHTELNSRWNLHRKRAPTQTPASHRGETKTVAKGYAANYGRSAGKRRR